MKKGLEIACALFFKKKESPQIDFKKLNMLNAIALPS